MSTHNAPPISTAFDDLKSEVLKTLRVSLPGFINAVNADGTVDVRIGVMGKASKYGTKNGLDFKYPILPSLPLFVLQGNGVGIVAPPAPDDGCLAIFSDRDLSDWFATGAVSPLPSLRMHDIADGFALVGFNPQTLPLLTPLVTGEAGLCETKSATGAKVAINKNTHMITIASGPQNLSVILLELIATLITLNSALAAQTMISSVASAASGNTAAITKTIADLNKLLY